MNVQIVNISSSETSIAGKYRSEGIVLVLCDATNAAFTVYLPDAKADNGTLFIFKKTDSSSNAVMIACRNSQYIDADTSKSLAGQYDHVSVISNKSNYSIVGAG